MAKKCRGEDARMKVTQNNFNAADNILSAFQNELNAQRGKKISEEQYLDWYAQSELIHHALQRMIAK